MVSQGQSLGSHLGSCAQVSSPRPLFLLLLSLLGLDDSHHPIT